MGHQRGIKQNTKQCTWYKYLGVKSKHQNNGLQLALIIAKTLDYYGAQARLLNFFRNINKAECLPVIAM